MARILVVEDDEDTAKLLTKRLMLSGFEVFTVSDGVQATRQIHQFKPDLIILDLMFPAGGGFSFLERLKLFGVMTRIPIIVLTGSQKEEHRERVRSFDVAAYLEKPYDAEVLLSEIKKILKMS